MFTPSAGKLIGDRYLLEYEIARGGMGVVWRAYDQQLSAPCALKFILQAFATHPELRARFVREAKAIAGIQSPHLVSVRGVGECEDSLYIAMELLEGEALSQRLERDGQLSPELTATLVDQVASVLTKAHAAGIVHRDLKPDNLWLWGDGPFFVKVLDFGVAKHVAEESVLRTATGALVGTPHYMSPEQAEGAKSVDHRADIWALAVIALECVSGKRPFDGTSLAELLIKVARTAPPTVASVAPGYTRLQPWWQRATAPAKSRYDSVRELAADFRVALASAEPQPEPHTQRIGSDRTELAPVAAVRANVTEVLERPANSTTAPFTSSLGRRTQPQGAHTELDQSALGLPSSAGFPSWAAALLGGAAVLALAGTGYYLYGNQAADLKEALTAASSGASAIVSASASPATQNSATPQQNQPTLDTASTPVTTTLAKGIAPAAPASVDSSRVLKIAPGTAATIPLPQLSPRTEAQPPVKAAANSVVPLRVPAEKPPAGALPANGNSRRNARPSNDVDKRLGF